MSCVYRAAARIWQTIGQCLRSPTVEASLRRDPEEKL